MIFMIFIICIIPQQVVGDQNTPSRILSNKSVVSPSRSVVPPAEVLYPPAEVLYPPAEVLYPPAEVSKSVMTCDPGNQYCIVIQKIRKCLCNSGVGSPPCSGDLQTQVTSLGTHWITDWLTDLLTGWLAEWLNGRLTDLLTNWLTEWLTDRLSDWLTDWVTDKQTEWLNHCLTDSLTHWLTDWLTRKWLFILSYLRCDTWLVFIEQVVRGGRVQVCFVWNESQTGNVNRRLQG